MALVFPGKLYPRRFTAHEPPTSVATRVKYTSKDPTRRAEASDSAPKSALQLLCCCRQIRDEALGIFYWHTTSSSSLPLLWLGSSALTVDRLRHVRNLTVFHWWQSERNRLWLGDALVTVKLLPKLRKLCVLLPERNEPSRCPGSFSDASSLFQLRDLKIIEVRDVRLHDDHSKKANQEKSAWRHFNRGLALEQKGVVVSALY